MRRPTQREAFKGCPAHRTFNFYCHGCLVATVGNLCDIIDKREAERAKQALRYEQQKKRDAMRRKKSKE